MSIVTEELKAKAEIYYGDEACQEKCKFLFREVLDLPCGLIPTKDMVEGGYVPETGFIWLKQKKKIEHRFEKIGRLVSYATEITANVEKGKMKNITGVKAKELLVWLNVEEISADNSPCGYLTFKSSLGVSRSFLRSAFELEEDLKKEQT